MSGREFLKKMTAVHGVSGYEGEVQKAFLEYIGSWAQDTGADALGSVWGRINVGRGPAVLLECHADQIGFLVRYISEDGLIYLQPVGSHSTKTAVSQRVLIQTKDGAVEGVIGTKPHHMQNSQERTRAPEITEIWCDIGAASAESVKRLVRPGDPVSYLSEYMELRGGERIAAPALDDRAGMYVVAEVFRRLSRDFCAVEVTALSSVQEELGLRGAQAAIKAFKRPVVALVFDVCHAIDTPGLDKRLLGEAYLGKGPVIVRGPIASPKVVDKLTEIADRLSIKYQLVPSAAVSSTDAGIMQLEGTEVETGVLSIPIRYMHTPSEILDVNDLEAAVELSEAFVRSFQGEGS